MLANIVSERDLNKHTAFFSLVCDSVEDAQPMMTELTAYAPIGKMKHATYRAAVFKVAAASAKPAMATLRPAVMCHVLSCQRPELQPKNMPAAPANINGGQVMTRVIVVLKPKVLTTLAVNYVSICFSLRSLHWRWLVTYVGKKELNEQADRWKFCIKQKSHVLLSEHACLRPSHDEVGWSSASVILSFSIRELASSLSLWVNHHVVVGVFGSRKNPATDTTAVAIPSTMKSLTTGQ